MSNRLYQLGEAAAEAFLLHSGEIQYWVNDSDYVALSGKNIIVGASELLIAMNRKEAVCRHFSLVALPDAQYSHIPADKLASFIKTYAVGFSVAHHIAQTITKLHSVLSEKMNRLHETERSLRDLSITYVEIVGLLENESRSRHFPWLFSMVEKARNSSAYNFGLAFTSVSKEKKIDISAENLARYKQIYPAGSIICKEGGKGSDMFILMDGKIEVRIKSNPIDFIVKKGTIIGEMGLILGTPRTATLRALEDVHVVRIGSGDMVSIFQNDPATFFNMVSSLAFREKDNCEKINEYSDMVKRMAFGKEEESLRQVHEYSQELAGLVRELEGHCERLPGEEWLEQIRDHIRRKSSALLADAGIMTGNTYVGASPKEHVDIMEKPSGGGQAVHTSVPEIDWF